MAITPWIPLLHSCQEVLIWANVRSDGLKKLPRFSHEGVGADHKSTLQREKIKLTNQIPTRKTERIDSGLLTAFVSDSPMMMSIDFCSGST